MHILASWLKMHFAWFGRIVDGTPVVVFEQGGFNRRRIKVLRMTEQDIITPARQHGLMRLDQMRYAVAERDGKISIVEAQQPPAGGGDPTAGNHTLACDPEEPGSKDSSTSGNQTGHRHAGHQ